MKKTPYLFLAGLAAWPCLLQAQPIAHYVPGVEGIKGPSLPPPGLYLRDYNVFYASGQLNDGAGNNTHINFDAFTYAQVPRLIWITDLKFLGGNVGVDALVPFTYNSLKVGPVYDDSAFGIGDLFAESTLSWHPKQFDFSVGAGFWAPTGGSSRPVSAGTGYWTPMLTAGATWYADAAKTWSVSALNRYEFNTESRDTHDTRGQAYTLEWGVAKTIKTVDFGLVGYYQEKVTADSVAAVMPHDSVAAIGPEVNVVFPKWMLFASLRYDYELVAYDRAQGHTVALTLTKRF
jgi:hypothetical protein